MARTILVLCDPCQADDVDTPAETYTVGMASQWFTVDLCGAHAKAIVEPVADALTAYGVKVAPESTKATPARQNGTRPSEGGEQWCLCGVRFTSQSGLRNHALDHHGITLAELFGTTCPMCGTTAANLAGMGAHAATAHALHGVAATFAYAETTGDDLGIVSARRAAISQGVAGKGRRG
jgi:type IV secretory pathway VirB6-like protein